jgi:hypothetical protein
MPSLIFLACVMRTLQESESSLTEPETRGGAAGSRSFGLQLHVLNAERGNQHGLRHPCELRAGAVVVSVDPFSLISVLTS